MGNGSIWQGVSGAGRVFARSWLVAGLMGLLAQPAHADVIEVGADGAVAMRSGAGAVRWHGRYVIASTDDLPLTADGERTGEAAVAAIAGVPARYASAIALLGDRYRVSPALLEAIIWQESRWREKAVSKSGAIGLSQLMPATARNLGVDPHDPLANLEGGARYLRAQLDLFDGDIEKALAAYNAGPGRVMRAGGIPPIAETQAYVGRILTHLAAMPASASLSGD